MIPARSEPNGASADSMRPFSAAGNGFRNPPSGIFRSLAATLVLLAAAVSSGCVYRMDIQQGNYLEARTVDQLSVGMTRSQVRYLLGTPMVPDAFDKDRWDYLYFYRRGRLHTPYQRHLIVFFKEDKVNKFDKDNVPTAAPELQPQEPSPQEQAPIAKFPKL
jgi:outer membrane protein assembly factor BamE